jgi:hypothetical protein
MPSSDIKAVQDEIVGRLTVMDGVSVTEDNGVHKEEDIVLPSGYEELDGMWVREVKVSLDSKSWTDVFAELDIPVSGESPLTVVRDSNLKRGESVTIRICCADE